jgi:hypothetical protein
MISLPILHPVLCSPIHSLASHLKYVIGSLNGGPDRGIILESYSSLWLLCVDVATVGILI